jgi:hypothetical protein
MRENRLCDCSFQANFASTLWSCYLFGAPAFKNDKVEYTDVSRLKRLRLEDSFLPGSFKTSILLNHDTA